MNSAAAPARPSCYWASRKITRRGFAVMPMHQARMPAYVAATERREVDEGDWGDVRVSLRDPIWYFSYGSNMSRAILLGRRGLHPRSSCVGWLDDHRLAFNLPVGPGERGVANLEPEPGARTCGVLHLLAAEDCDRLDRTEGVHVGVYRRVPVEVRVDAEEAAVAAFTYRSSRTVVGRRPSPRYMRLLLEGAAEHGLPGVWVRFLQSFELAVDEREPLI